MTWQRFRAQRSIGRPVEVCGTGFLTGATVHLRFVPAPPSTGIVFVRTDLRDRPRIAAEIDNVTGTERRTTLGHPPAQVGLVEHVMAALAGLQIDNCIVQLDAPEPPGLDGSSAAFVTALWEAGVTTLAAQKPIWQVSTSLVVQHGTGSVAIHPSPGTELTISYFLDYGPHSAIARQIFTQTVTPSAFAQHVAASRTFLLEAEALELRHQGLGSRTTMADLLVFGPNGPIDNRLRWANEPARHKALDIVGDLALLGVDLAGHVVACRSGHPHNAALVRALQREMQSDSASVRRAA
jgi:UDP-3-O-acyl N-acetylglucosamine deacetylase